MIRLASLIFVAMAGLASAQPIDPSRMVFFDWGKSELTGDAKATLDKAATDFAASGSTQIVLRSHSDRSGSAAVNLRLSRQRAQLAADYLASKGVAASAIGIEAVGEDEPLIETQDGVREVQNRRIDIRFLP